MAQIDEIKERINWLKDLFKILVMVLIALIAGVSKLFLNKDFNILFCLGAIVSVFVILWLMILFFKINKDIQKLRELQ